MKGIDHLLPFFLLAGWFLLSNSSIYANAPAYDCQIEPLAGENFGYAPAELWVPQGVKEVSGVLCIVLHPIGPEGSTLAKPNQWIKLATDLHCALMTISFARSDDFTQDWCDADKGTGRALFAALEVFASKSEIINLSRVPVVVCGVCAAGQFAYQISAFNPKRIAAFITIGGGKHDLSKAHSAAKVPALIVVTPDRGIKVSENLKTLYLKGQSYSAPWFCVSENISQYDAGMLSVSVFSYLQETLKNLESGSPAHQIPAIRTNGLSSYLPISICGERLAASGSVQPQEMELGTVDSLSKSTLICSFNVLGGLRDNPDRICVPTLPTGVEINIQQLNAEIWHVTCRIDLKKVSLGPFHIQIPVRFFRNGIQLLGGTAISLDGAVTGDIECVPNNLNFGTLEAGKTGEAKIRIVSNEHMSIGVGTITGSVPWIKAISHSSENGSTELLCSLNPPIEFHDSGFSGYLQIQIETPIHRVLRVYYYGLIN
jgi:hypothetical protein